MKKSLVALAVLSAFAGVAHAEGTNSVEVYGILDVGVAELTHAGNFNPNFVTSAVPVGVTTTNNSTIGMMNGGESQTRIGFKGNKDLGDGYKAFFQLESAINLGSGTLGTSSLAGGAGSPNMMADTALNGQLFNRNAFVGISSDSWGALSAGRQNSLQLDIIGVVGGGYDPVNAQMFSPINFSGAYGGGGATDNSRVDNSIKYAKKFGNINMNALYGMGGVSGAPSARSNAQFNVGYEADTFGVQAAVQSTRDTTSITATATPNTVNAQFEDLLSYMIALRYQAMEGLALKAGFERESISAPGSYDEDRLMTTIYSYNLAANTAFGPNKRDLNVYWLGANYQFSPATKLSVGYYNVVAASGTGSANGAALTTSDVTDTYWSAMVEYNLSKDTNLYAAAMFDTKTAASVSSYYNTYGAGVRVKF